jgi:CheY-like chemotaxis protein
VNPLVLVVDDEPDVEVLFRQQFRRDLRAGRFTMEFAQSAPMALQRITDAAGGVAHLNPLRHQHAGDERDLASAPVA